VLIWAFPAITLWVLSTENLKRTPQEVSGILAAIEAKLPHLATDARTSGEIRLSGFLLWQSIHTEFYFTDVFWPAFGRIDFLRAVRAYQQRRRRCRL
jgi:short-chain Z-isoprenyl diphosphate synthase